MSERYLRFRDLQELGIVNSRMTLHRLVKNHNFPIGVMLTPNSRAWPESSIDEWLASRPTAKKASVPRK